MSGNILSVGPPTGVLGVGSSVSSIIGTQESGPRGVESIIEYNDLTMNVRDWIDTYLVTNIGGLDDADVRDNREANPDEDGETPGDSLYGGRTITLQGKIVTKTIWKLRDMEQALRTAFADLGSEKPLYFRSNSIDTDLFINCKKHQKLEWNDEQQHPNHFQRPFQISLRASNPRFLSYLDVYSLYEPDINNAAGDVNVFDLLNKGSYKAQPVIKITGPLAAPSAGAKAVKITNQANGNVFWLRAGLGSATLLASGKSLEIDFRGLGTKVTELDSSGNIVALRNKFIDPESDKILLEPANIENPILVDNMDPSGSIVRVEARHHHTYM